MRPVPVVVSFYDFIFVIDITKPKDISTVFFGEHPSILHSSLLVTQKLSVTFLIFTCISDDDHDMQKYRDVFGAKAVFL
jgi:hypothetical protein